MLYLDGQGSCSYKIQQPGAIHNARWMAKILTSLKLLLLEDKINLHLPKGQIFRSQHQRNKIYQFVRFVIFVYLPYWYTASSSVNSPHNDLNLWNSINQYSNHETKNAALKAFQNHTWYLTEELILLSLFSPKVSDAEKQEITQKLLTCNPSKSFKNRHGTGYGKPVLPNIQTNSKLSDFVGPSSWFFFELLNIDTSFLTESIGNWQSVDAYKGAEKKVLCLAVVNDTAERGVKLAQDFLQASKCEARYQNVLQVVEHHRQRHPNQRKSTKL